MRLSILVATSFIALSIMRNACAKDLPYRLNLAQQSARFGLGGKEVVVLKRSPSPGRDKVFNQIRGKLASSASAISTSRLHDVATGTDHIVANGDGWFLEVRGDGEWVRFRNDGYLDSPLNQPVPAEDRMPVEELELIARRVIDLQLSDLVRLGDGQALVPWESSYLVAASTDASGDVRRLVHAGRLVFTRVVDGVPILGGGSKVAVIVAATGEPVGFDVDWADLVKTPKRTTAINLVAIRARFARMVRRPGHGAKESRFECGYYDMGSTGGTRSAFVQPACMTVTEPEVGNPALDVVPIGFSVEEDLGWPISSQFGS